MNSRGRTLRLMCAVLTVVLGRAAFSQPALTEGGYTNAALDGFYWAQDLFAKRDGNGDVARGNRDFDGKGKLVSFVTVASRSPLDYTMTPDGRFRLSGDGIDFGTNGTLGMAGALTIFTPNLAPDQDRQIRQGYAAMRVSLLRPNGLSDASFVGDYSFHALVYTGADWRNLYGVAAADGKGTMLLTRSTVGLLFDYDVNSAGGVSLGDQSQQTATLTQDANLLVHTITLGRNDDPAVAAGYEGLALYLRRKPSGQSFNIANFRGRYRIHELRVAQGGTLTTTVDSVIAGGGGVFFKSDGTGTPRRITLNASGTFTLPDTPNVSGTLTSDGDLAVVSPTSGAIFGTNNTAWLQIWVRTAGGGALPNDQDGDGQRDSSDTNDGNRDRDGDGFIDGWDARPDIADNVFTATLSQSSFNIIEGAANPAPVTLTLDSDNFPFFAWSLQSSVPWLTLSKTSGTGDDTVTVSINTNGFTTAGSPYRGTIAVTAPQMKPVAPLEITVNVSFPQVRLNVSPAELAFTAVEKRPLPPAQTLSIDSDDADTFSWTASASAAWIKLGAASGNGPGTLSVSIDSAGLSAAQSPFTGTVTLRAQASSAPPVEVPVTLTLLAARDPGDPFPIGPQFSTQTNPAAAASKGRYVVAWTERDAIRASILAADGVPLVDRATLSIVQQGNADNAVAVARGNTGAAWVVWEQQLSPQTVLSARVINLETGSIGPLFGLSGTTNAGPPALAYDAAADVLYVACVQPLEAGYALNLRRYAGASNNLLGTVPVAIAADAAQLRTPSLDFDPEHAEILVAWHDATAGNVRAQRIAQESLTTVGAAIGLGDGDSPQVAWNRAQSAWAVLVRRGGDLALLRFAGGTSTPAVAPLTVVAGPVAASSTAMRYGDISQTFRAIWGTGASTPQLFTRQITAGGRFFDNAAALAPANGEQFDPALTFNAAVPEWLAAWVDRRGIFRQVYALRLTAVNADADGDGLPNEWELEFGLDPNDATGDNGGMGDPDGDGLTNLEELRMGTDPTKADTDGDGLLDRLEDRDRDGVVDAGESSPTAADTDGDGFDDAAERYLGSDANNNASLPPAGIVRASYAPGWRAGIPAPLRVQIAVRDAGDYAFATTLTGGWNIAQDSATALQALTPGSHSVDFSVTPPAITTPGNLLGDLRLRLNGPGVDSTLDLVLVLDTATTRADAQALAERHAPILRQHRDEPYRPIPVIALLKDADFVTRAGARFGAPLDVAELSLAPQAGARLDLPGTTSAALRSAYLESAAAATPVAYYTATALGASAEPDIPAGATALQYYFLYYADEWGDTTLGGHRHEGDWAMVQVLLDADDAPIAVTMSQHAERAPDDASPGTLRLPWAAVERLSDTHPVVYAGRGGHALYPAAGSTRLAPALDVHDGRGVWLLPPGIASAYADTASYRLTPLPRLREAGTPPWLGYAGRWGQAAFPAEPGDSPTPNAQDGGAGPVLLGTRDRADDATGVRSAWLDPWALQQRAAAPATQAPATLQGTLPGDLGGTTLVLLDAEGRAQRFTADSTGAFSITVPPRMYTLSVVERDQEGRETYVATLRLSFGGVETLLVPTRSGGTVDLGTLTREDNALRGIDAYAQTDADGDLQADASDSDADGDGMENAADADVLGDGFDDAVQAGDGNGNLVPDYFEADAPLEDDYDADGVDDVLDRDDDNDGFDDAAELEAGTDPLNFFDTPARRAGDLDANGTVDAADLQLLINIALGLGEYTTRAELYFDGRIDVVDVQRAVARILAR